MIRHSAYCLTQEGVDMLANYFFEEEGLDAFPVLQSEQSSSLLKQDKRVILIPESYTILWHYLHVTGYLLSYRKLPHLILLI